MALVAVGEVTAFAVMPAVAKALHGLPLYGWTLSVFALSTVVALVAGGRAVDALGPRRPYVVGLVCYLAGILLVSLAPNMPVVVAGRGLMGIGHGLFFSAAFAAQSLLIPAELRSRLIALSTSTWLPAAVVVPPLATLLEAGWSWRLAYLPTAALAVASLALGTLGFPRSQDDKREEKHGWRLAFLPKPVLVVAVGLGLVLIGGQLAASVAQSISMPRVVTAAAVALAGTVVAVLGLLRLLPAGTLRAARGVPVIVLIRGLTPFAVLALQTFETLALMVVREEKSALAALAIPAAELGLLVGGWAFHHLSTRWSSETLMRWAALAVAVGSGGFLLTLFYPQTWLGLAFFAVAVRHLGWGLAYSVTTEALLHLTPAGQEGEGTSTGNMFLFFGTALGAGTGGVLVAGSVAATSSLLPGLVAAVACVAAAMALAAVVAGRMTRGVARSNDGLVVQL